MLTQPVFEDYDLSVLPTTNPGSNKPWRVAVGSGWQIVVGAFAVSAVDHGALTGLGDDDHPQYFNQARGDARYYPLTGGALGGPIHATHSNIDYTNANGAGSHVKLINPYSNGQNVLSNVINGSMVSKWRNDYLGNMTFVGANYYLFTGGDYGVGKCNIRVNGGVGPGNGVSISNVDLVNYSHPTDTALYVVGNEKVAGLVDAVSLRASGNNPPTSGAGIELVNVGGACYLQAYSRDSASYLPLTINASSISIGGAVSFVNAINVGDYSTVGGIRFIGSAGINTIWQSNSGVDLSITTNGGRVLLGAGVSNSQIEIDLSGNVRLNSLTFKKPFTVATLPSAAANAGAEAQVTNATVAAAGNYGATVAGGGTNRVKVFSNGVNWIIC